MKAAGLDYCNPGARRWFAHHKLDWSDFIVNGISEEVLLATGDAMALAVVEEARNEWAARVADKQ
jgi:hypothetical protein